VNTTNTNEIQRIIGNYIESLYSNVLETFNKWNEFLDVCDQPKVNQEHINHSSRFITSSETEAAIKSLPKKKGPGPH
jgi:hypothetical protein